MKFAIATFFALVAAVSAYSVSEHNAFVERQVDQGQVETMDPSIPAMTNANGEVVPFDAANVYLAAAAAGI